VCDEASEALGRYFAVFDGHGPGGEGAAAFAARNLRRLAEARASRALASIAPLSHRNGDDDPRTLEALTHALKDGFRDCESELARQARAPAVDARGGTVALVACLPTLPRRGDSDALLVAWAGDACALLRRGGVTQRCAPERTCVAAPPLAQAAAPHVSTAAV
jgi:serine/threonine protein phosphatase PrpC